MGDQTSTLEECLLDANREFLTHLDEFVFVKSAFLAVGEKHFQSEHVESLADQLRTNAASMAKELAATGALLAHQFRFFQAEAALMLLLAGSRLHRPYLETLKRLRGDKWDRALRALASRKVPPDFELMKGGVPLTFDDWVLAALWRHSGAADEALAGTIEYVASEAKFLEKKDGFNAFKHGVRARGGGFQIHAAPEEDQTDRKWTMEAEHAVLWMEWPQLDVFSYTRAAKEFVPSHDMTRIHYGAQLVRLWKEVRLANFDSKRDHTIYFFDAGREPSQGYKFTHRFGLAPSP